VVLRSGRRDHLVDAARRISPVVAVTDYPEGEVSVLKPQGTEETGADRPASPLLLPTLGRIVHFTDEWGGTYAAIVTNTYGVGLVDLEVFGTLRDNDDGLRQRKLIKPRSEPEGFGWFWPPRA
jgi:hypothetical protein